MTKNGHEAPPHKKKMARNHSLVVEHYNIDTTSFKMRPDPMLHYDKNLARDVHDIFNLVVLIPVVALNLANWGPLPSSARADLALADLVPALWRGTYFMQFWWTTFAYFVADAIFVLAYPRCVRSPSVIIKHHLATLGYIFLPLWYREAEWIMGSCMIVEINTWLLIARRFFNRAGDKPFFSIGVPFTKSLRIKLISVFFYLTWLSIRILGYPLLLFPIYQHFTLRTAKTGSRLNVIAVGLGFHLVFITLNFKWTVDLVRSKIRPRRSRFEKGL